MTKIVSTAECRKRFQEDFQKGLFSEEDGIVLKAWAREMEGLQGLMF
jgi:hypothetical protein